MRLPLSVILVVAVIVILVTVAGIFVWRGLSPATSSDPSAGAMAGATPAASGGSTEFALPASQGMATFTPVPQDQIVPTAIPTALPLPADTAIVPTPAPAVPTPEIAPPLDAQAPVSADATGNNDLTNAPPLDAQAPSAGAGAGLTNGNIQVTPVPAVPVNGSGGGTSGGGSGNSGGSGSSGGGAACGTRLYHIVRPGENLFRIGLRYNTTAYAIARMNGITNVRLVSSGRRLLIVACARGSGGGGGQYTPRSSTYVVKPGDTLFRIALNFGINTQYLCQVNGLTSNLIVPGQVLVIP